MKRAPKHGIASQGIDNEPRARRGDSAGFFASLKDISASTYCLCLHQNAAICRLTSKMPTFA